MEILSPRQHAWVDIAAVVVFALAPPILGLEGAAAAVSYVLAGIHLVVTLLTAGLPGAPLTVIPLALHGLVESVVGIALALIGLIFFDGTAAGYFIVMGAIVLAVFVVTNYTPSGD